MHKCEFRDLGRMRWRDAFALQQRLVSDRKQGLIPDQLLVVEHPHVVTAGRNARRENLLAGEEILAKSGIDYEPTDRGGDLTYHGPGQIVAYPILDLREWKRDVVAYVRALEQVIIDTLDDFGVRGGRLEGCTGVWVEGAKVAAIGVHISRWVTSHGLALNVDTDLDYFRYIVPCGLARPVTSVRRLGSGATRAQVTQGLVKHFARAFDREILEPAWGVLRAS